MDAATLRRMTSDTAATLTADDRFILGRETTALAGYSMSQIERMMAAGTFPRPVIDGNNGRAWRRWSWREVIAWQQQKIRERDEREAARAA